MKTRENLFQLVLLGIFCLLLPACGAQAGVSPTPNPLIDLGSEAGVGPTLLPEGRISGPGKAIGAVIGPQATAVADMAQPSPTSSFPTVATPGEPSPTYGAVVGPDHTPPPTFTPWPTPIPTLPVIATDGAVTPAFGPVVGPDHTPPPTLTPWPTPGMTPGTLPPVFTPGPSPTPSALLRADLMGVQVHGYLTDDQFSAMLDRAEELGVRWIKLQINWALYEPARGQFSDLYHAQILNVQRASLRGFRTMLSVAKAPDWARPAGVRGVESGPPDDPQLLADFIARLVRETKPEFIDAIEIWNEANLISEWRGKPLNGGVYMGYFRAAYAAILSEQRAQPSRLKPFHRIRVITAGPAPTITLGDGSTVGDREWLQQLYDSGLADFGPDVMVGAHPYGWANPPEARCCAAAPGVTGWYEHPSFYFRETLEAYRDIMLRNNHVDGKIWVTEFGWATYDGLNRSDGSSAFANPNYGWQSLINQQQQADYTLRAFRLAQQPPYYDFLGPMILWNLNYSMVPEAVDRGSEQAGFSLLDASGQPRPVFNVLKSAPKE